MHFLSIYLYFFKINDLKNSLWAVMSNIEPYDFRDVENVDWIVESVIKMVFTV